MARKKYTRRNIVKQASFSEELPIDFTEQFEKCNREGRKIEEI